MFKLIELTFQQANWAILGWSWNSIGGILGVIVSVCTILGLLYKLYKTGKVSRLLKEFNSIGFERIAKKTASELNKSDKQFEQALTMQSKQVVPEELPNLFKSYVDYKGKIKLFVEDLGNFIRVYDNINRIDPQRIALISDDVKKLSTTYSKWISDIKENEKEVAVHEASLKGGNVESIIGLIRMFCNTRNSTIDNLNVITPTLEDILRKMEVILKNKKK